MYSHRFSLFRLTLGTIVFLALSISPCFSGDAVLKSGFRIQGAPVPIISLDERTAKKKGPNFFSILMISTGHKWYFVPKAHLQSFDKTADLNRDVTFELKQPRRAKRGFTSLGSIFKVTKFSPAGRRTLSTKIRDKKVDIVVGVVKITPRYLSLKGITHVWEHGIATSSVSSQELDAMIRTATDPEDPNDRLAIARFYLQAGRYNEADRELDAIFQKFPTLKATAQKVREQLHNLIAQKILSELKKRQAVGQHRLAQDSVKLLAKQKNLHVSSKKEIDRIRDHYAVLNKQIEEAKALMEQLAERAKPSLKKELVSQIDPVILEISKNLNFESIHLLNAFRKLASDPSLKAEQKLALAFSGWCLDSSNAVTELKTSLNLWKARTLIFDYVKTSNTVERRAIAQKFTDLEGIDPRMVRKMIPHLPMQNPVEEIEPGKPYTVVLDEEETSRKYSVLLPPEYNPFHKYPMIVALRPGERTIDQMVQWWGGTPKNARPGARQGYIVISPEYRDGKPGEYRYDMDAHRRVIEAIHDARKRFRVDSDRIYLTGHGTGGDAAFDIGMSHPHMFAGVVPIAAIADKFCRHYWMNAKDLPFYIVSGELCRGSPEKNGRIISQMIKKKQDVIYVEYTGRGYEAYDEEIHRIFEWMNLQRRKKYPTKFEMKILRPTESEFFWVSAEGIEIPRIAWNASPRFLSVSVAPKGNQIRVSRGGSASMLNLWLAPEFIDFDQKLRIIKSGRRKFFDFVTPDYEALLEDFRTRGDREKTFLARVRLK